MFEPQDHPDDIPYPGGPPTRPYDSAGWTLAFQMGVVFDRVLEPFDGPFDRVQGLQPNVPGTVTRSGNGAVVLSHAGNNAFIAVNRLLAAGRDVRWIQNGGGYPFHVTGATTTELQKLASELGVSFAAPSPSLKVDGAITLRRPRIGLADQYGGSMTSGWTRLILEQFEFPFEVVYPKVLNTGNLASRFDVLIFPSGVGPAQGSGRRTDDVPSASAGSIPVEYEPMLGSYTAAETGPALRRFGEDGGTILAVGRSSMTLAQLFALPVSNHLLERSPDGSTRPLPAEKYYVPGSILRVAVDNTAPVAHGLGAHVDVL